MTKGIAFRPKLLPPRGHRLEESRRSSATCLSVSGSLVLLVSIVFGLTAFNIYSHRFGKMEHKFHAGDEVSFDAANSDLAPTFCSAYTIRPQGWADFYLLSHAATLDRTDRRNLSFTMTAEQGHIVFEVRTHYLTANSTVSLSACHVNKSRVLAAAHPAVDLPTEFLVILNEHNFKDWHKHFSNRHVKYRVEIPEKALCGENVTSLPHLHLTVPKAADYYFVLILHHKIPDQQNLAGEVTLTGNISRTEFNITDAVKICNSTEEFCRIPLSWGSRPNLVVKLREDQHIVNAVASFSTKCEVRLEFWIPVFGLLPLIIMTLISLGCWYLLVKRQKLHSRYRVPRRTQTANRNYGSCVEDEAPLMAEPPAPDRVPADEEGVASIQD